MSFLFTLCGGSEVGKFSASRRRREETMVPLRVSTLLLVGTASLRCRSSGLVAAAAAPLPSFPGYCSKNMSRNAIPSLEQSLTSSFGDSVSADDVQLLQVRCRLVVRCLGCEEKVVVSTLRRHRAVRVCIPLRVATC